MGLVAGLVLLACGRNRPPEEQSGPNELPYMEIRLLNGDTIDARSLETERVAIVLFQPDCDHCQREAAQIREHLNAFEDYKLYFVSSSGGPEVGQFAATYGLEGHDNVIFGVTTVQSILDNYGAIQAPSMYIYSKGGALVQALNGEVDISVILKYL